MPVLFPAILLVAWAAAWFTYIAPKLRAYRRTAGIMAEIEATEHSFVTWLGLRLRGLKTVLVSVLVSGLATVKTATDSTVTSVTGLQPADLDPLKNADLWHAFLSDKVVLQIIAFLGIATAMLAIKGHLQAAQVVPQPDHGGH